MYVCWLQCRTTFLREFNFSDRRYIFVLRELIFENVKDWFFVLSTILCNFQKVALVAFFAALHGKLWFAVA